jgi:hypothetical protein
MSDEWELTPKEQEAFQSGKSVAYENVLEELLDFHIEKGQFGHLTKPSNVCGTCRIIAIVEELDQ